MEVSIVNSVEKLKERWATSDPLPLLMALIEQPTFGDELGVEDGAVRLLADRFDRLGMPYVVREERGRAYNFLAQVGEGGPSIILNSHLDVVPPGSVARWSTPPFAPHMVDGKVYGRGACDAKGSVAAMIAAFERLYANRGGLDGQVILSLVGAEEIGGLGILREVEMGLQADAAIVGEPTQLTPHVGHKGRMVIEVVTKGVPAHSSNPEAGVNAISKMARLITEFDALHQRVAQMRHPLLGTASSAVTRIHGGVAVNVVPGECVLQLDRRLLPGETPEGALKDYQDVLDRIRREDPQFSAEVHVLQAKTPAETQGVALPETITSAAEQVLGRSIQVAGFPATCDMTHLVHEGGIPTVIFGPGDLALAHQYNEWVSIDDLYLAAEIYYQTCLRWTSARG